MDLTVAPARRARAHAAEAVLVLEIGNERPHFERAFPLAQSPGSRPAQAQSGRVVTRPALVRAAAPHCDGEALTAVGGAGSSPAPPSRSIDRHDATRCTSLPSTSRFPTADARLNQVSLRRGVKLVLNQASVTLQPGEKVGLVGRNGAGKSSLFSLLAGRLHADAGDFGMPPRWRIAEVAQEMPETSEGATDFVLQGDTRLMEAQAALVAAEAADDGHAMADAHHAISDAGGFDARPRAQSMLLGLGFALGELDAPVDSFSGGWRMRLQLARALMCRPMMMSMTDNISTRRVVWLEAGCSVRRQMM